MGKGGAMRHCKLLCDRNVRTYCYGLLGLGDQLAYYQYIADAMLMLSVWYDAGGMYRAKQDKRCVDM